MPLYYWIKLAQHYLLRRFGNVLSRRIKESSVGSARELDRHRLGLATSQPQNSRAVHGTSMSLAQEKLD
jgi:hypothetical protein